MPLLNPSFEDAGALPGEAAHWTLRAFTSLEVLAGFGAAPEQAWEGFERWFPWWSSLGEVPTTLAFFDANTEGYEDFDEGWQNGVFLVEFPEAQLAVCGFGGGAVEDCERGWQNESFANAWETVASEAGVFDGESREAFERHWRANESYASQWGNVTSSAARFDAGATDVEAFENAWAHATTQ